MTAAVSCRAQRRPTGCRLAAPHLRVVASIAVVLAVCGVPPLGAQTDTFDQAWRWVHFTEEDGLPAKTVYDVIESSGGTPWANTIAGLAWYDGYEWHVAGAAHGLPESDLNALLPDSDGGGLFALKGGVLYQGDERGFRRLELHPAEADSYLMRMVPFADGLLLQFSKSLYTYRNDNMAPFDGPAGVSIVPMGTRTGATWGMSPSALYELRDGAWLRVLEGLVGTVVEPGDGSVVASVFTPLESRGLWEWTRGGAWHGIYHSVATWSRKCRSVHREM